MVKLSNAVNIIDLLIKVTRKVTVNLLNSCLFFRHQSLMIMISFLFFLISTATIVLSSSELYAHEAQILSTQKMPKKSVKNVYLGVTPTSMVKISRVKMSRGPAAMKDRSLEYKKNIQTQQTSKTSKTNKKGNKKANDNEDNNSQDSINFLDQSNLATNENLKKPNWINKLFANDENKILANAQEQVLEWEENEEYAERWNLESTGLYQPVNHESKVNYITKQTLRYFDKKISAESKKAEEGTPLKTVHNAQKILKPTTEVPISPFLKLRFKAHLLQGKATVLLKNPYVDWTAQVNAHGNVDVRMAKDLNLLGIKTEVNYLGHEGMWEAAFNKQISRSIAGQVSSKQEVDSMAFTGESDKRIQFNFSRPFEF